MYRMVLNGMLVPRTELLIIHVKGREGDLELVPKRMNKMNFLVSSLNVVTVMINTETWLGATNRTRALCRSISVSLHLNYFNQQIDPYCVLLFYAKF